MKKLSLLLFFILTQSSFAYSSDDIRECRLKQNNNVVYTDSQRFYAGPYATDWENSFKLMYRQLVRGLSGFSFNRVNFVQSDNGNFFAVGLGVMVPANTDCLKVSKTVTIVMDSYPGQNRYLIDYQKDLLFIESSLDEMRKVLDFSINDFEVKPMTKPGQSKPGFFEVTITYDQWK